MDILLAGSILSLAVVFGLSVLLGKPLKIEITHRMDAPPAQQVPLTPEEEDAEQAHKDVARVLQEIAGVFQDDNHATERTV